MLFRVFRADPKRFGEGKDRHFGDGPLQKGGASISWPCTLREPYHAKQSLGSGEGYRRRTRQAKLPGLMWDVGRSGAKVLFDAAFPFRSPFVCVRSKTARGS